MSAPSVIVVGAGWAGLACAAHLASRGVKVTVLEAGRRAGGRARSVAHKGAVYDNGQHLLLGAYRSILDLLRLIGVDERDVLERRAMRLMVRGRNGDTFSMTAPNLPAPLHLVSAMLTARGATWAQRASLLRCCVGMAVTRFRLAKDMTVDEWLAQQRQDEFLNEMFWRPLCLAALTTEPSRASARVFLAVMRDAFANKRVDSDMLFAKRPLGEVLPEPACAYIEGRGGAVVFGRRVTGLRVENDGVRGVMTDKETFDAMHTVIAVSPDHCRDLLLPHAPVQRVCSQLAAMFQEPIATVYLDYPATSLLPEPMWGLHGTLGHWLVDHSHLGTPGRLAVVMSAGGEQLRLSRDELGNAVAAELAELFPQWPRPTRIATIREKRAGFSSRVDIDKLRPAQQTPLRGCWLAGDYTLSDYPATLEGAVRSGIKCADGILATI